jgi:hypothetical protein
VRIVALIDIPITFANDIHPLNDVDCRDLFGDLSKMNGDRCICPETIAFVFESRCCKRIYFP